MNGQPPRHKGGSRWAAKLVDVLPWICTAGGMARREEEGEGEGAGAGWGHAEERCRKAVAPFKHDPFNATLLAIRAIPRPTGPWLVCMSLFNSILRALLKT